MIPQIKVECWRCGHVWFKTLTSFEEKVNCAICDAPIIIRVTEKGKVEFCKPSVIETVQLLRQEGYEVCSSPEIIEKIKTGNYVLEDILFSHVRCPKCSYTWIEICERKELNGHVLVDCPRCLNQFVLQPHDIGYKLWGNKS